MSIASEYAQALFEAAKDGRTDARTLAKNLKASLERRGHLKLLPRIASEWQKLYLRDERRILYSKVTPDMERTRILLQLYKKLIAAKN